MRVLTLDFETYDPLLLDYGMGWCFKYHYPECEFEVLGCGLIDHKGEEHYLDFTADNEFINLQWQALEGMIKNHDAILCHNSLYDIGALKYLFRDKLVWQDKILLDTVLLAKHDNQSRLSYSLDNLCTEYNAGEKKESDILHDYAWLSGMYKEDHKKRTGRNVHTRPSKAILNHWCMNDMRRFPVDIVREYCLQDVRATKALFDILDPLTNYIDRTIDSDLLKCCIDMKLNGVRIDINKAKELLDKNNAIARLETDKVYHALDMPKDFNINSPKMLGQLLVDAGYDVPRTEKGNISLKGNWLDEQEHGVFAHIRKYRKALKVNEYIQKLVDYQKAIPEKYIRSGIGWLYPTLKPYGATATGRFSSGGGKGCNELNIQQIPRRDEDFGVPIREVFLPHEGAQLICCDFSSQESRLQVHYAAVMRCTGARDIAQRYKDDPKTDFHRLVADICGISRENAKTINLGLSYGMGQTKLVNSLGVEVNEGKKILRQYHKLLPFMRQLQQLTEKTMVKNGYIKTIGGRKLKLGPTDYSDKALNKLIQGSAGDQIIRSMITAWKQGVKMLFSVHDEIVVSSHNPEVDMKVLIDCMCLSVPVCLPMDVEGGIGNNWREAK